LEPEGFFEAAAESILRALGDKQNSSTIFTLFTKCLKFAQPFFPWLCTKTKGFLNGRYSC
jgi:hypothetical protein